MTFYRPQRGSLLESMDEKRPVENRGDLAHLLGVTPTAIGLKPLMYDERIDWDTYLVTVKGEAVGFTNGPLA